MCFFSNHARTSVQYILLILFPTFFSIFLFFSDGFVLLWKKGKDLVALGSQLMKPDDIRVKLEESENGNTLVILLAETKDAGEYSCQISVSGEPPELRHSVRIRGKLLTYIRMY